ncbi:nuclear receptor-interacting protein 3 [Lynx rufus]|uniref:nuclear receptor-interacting protein 3 n=1 Tax=Lynx rufus TaxID=61384 RepID=UPI001F128055|nr:nuclear receptor-interacting protein 3 [Lynx rufus]
MAQLAVIPGSATAWPGLLSEGGRKETDMREAASLRQQRRMKQAVQFIHKDSADLLPLDGLKKLGSSKDTQPHNILQRRLMETNLSKLRSSRVPWASKTNKLNQAKSEGLKKSDDDDMILVSCQCAGKDVKALVDTGCQYNLISSACVDRLGLKEHVRSHKHEGEKLSLPRHLKVVGQIEHLVITLGSLRLDCPAAVVEDNEKNLSLGLQTLRSLKCIINLDKHRLIMGKTDKEEIPFVETVSLNEDNLVSGNERLRPRRGRWRFPSQLLGLLGVSLGERTLQSTGGPQPPLLLHPRKAASRLKVLPGQGCAPGGSPFIFAVRV